MTDHDSASPSVHSLVWQILLNKFQTRVFPKVDVFNTTHIVDL
jgi:hypothetical protein